MGNERYKTNIFRKKERRGDGKLKVTMRMTKEDTWDFFCGLLAALALSQGSWWTDRFPDIPVDILSSLFNNSFHTLPCACFPSSLRTNEDRASLYRISSTSALTLRNPEQGKLTRQSCNHSNTSHVLPAPNLTHEPKSSIQPR